MVKLKKLRVEKIRKIVGDGIEIYNIQADDKKKILKITSQYLDVVDSELMALFIIRDILPILTNISIDGLDDVEIFDILQNPSDDLKVVIKEIDDMINEFVKSTVEFAKQYKDMENSYNDLVAKWEKEAKNKK